MIRFIRRGQPWKLIRIGKPIKFPRVHNTTAYRCVMAIQVFRGGMDNDVCPPLKRTAVDRRGKSIVNDQWHSVGMCSLGKPLDIKYDKRWIGNGFTKYCLSIGLECRLQFFLGTIWIHKGKLDPHALHRHRKEIIGSPVDRR